MKYIKLYEAYSRLTSKVTENITDDFIDDLNDITQELVDDNNISLKAWLEVGSEDDEREDWVDVDRLESAISLAVMMLPKPKKGHGKFCLTKQEVNDMVEFMKRISDFNNDRYEIYIHYHTRDKKTYQSNSSQKQVDIKDIDILNEYSFPDVNTIFDAKEDFISNISITICND